MNRRIWCFVIAATLFSISIYLTRPTDDEQQAVQTAPVQLKMSSARIAETMEEKVNNKKEPVVSADDCYEKFKAGYTAENLLERKEHYLIGFFNSLDAHNYHSLHVNTIGDIAGLNQQEILAARTGISYSEIAQFPNEVLLADDYSSKSLLPHTQRSLFNDLMTDEDYPGLAQAFYEQRLDAKSTLSGKSLLAEVIAKNPHISQADIESLIDAGAEISLDAIVQATRSSDSALVKFLAENYPKKIDQSWTLDNTNINLAMTAATAFRDDLYFYFVDKGVRPFINDYYEYSSLIDVMPEPTTEDQKKRALATIEHALKNGARASRHSSAERLKKWLPVDLQHAYRVALSLTDNTHQTLTDLGNQLKTSLAQMQRAIHRAQQLESACKEQHNFTADTYAERLLETDIDTATLPLITKKLLTQHIENEKNKRLDAQIDQALANATDEQKQQGLEIEKAFGELYDKVMDKQWDQALAQCTHADEKSRPLLCTQLLHRYVGQKNVDWEYIEQLLPYTGPPDSRLVSSLVIQNKAELLKRWIDEGLQLNQLEYWEDPVSKAIKFAHNTEALAVLLKNGMPPKHKSYGLDALDIGLAHMETFNASMKRPDGSPFFSAPQDIALLIKAGAAVERSHVEKIQQLKAINPSGYQALITAVPALAAY